MSVVLRKLTVEDLESFPEDGHRYEIIDGDLSMSPAPAKKHQRLLSRIFRAFETIASETKTGECFFSPVDVRLSEFDQVQPDLIFIRVDRSGIYQGSTVLGPPDIVVEVISPLSKSYDEVAKLRLYQKHGVPEYWLFDPEKETVRLLALVDGALIELNPDASGRCISRQLSGLVIDPEELFKDIDL